MGWAERVNRGEHGILRGNKWKRWLLVSHATERLLGREMTDHEFCDLFLAIRDEVLRDEEWLSSAAP